MDEYFGYGGVKLFHARFSRVSNARKSSNTQFEKMF